MKRIVFIILIIGSAPTVAAAEQNKMTLISQNDMYGGGYTLNRDDGRTFGFLWQLNYSDWLYRVGYYAYTSRYNSVYRDDQFKVALGYSFNLFDRLFSLPLQFDMAPAVGVAVSGNLGGEYIQNFFHSFYNIPSISLVYGGYYVAPSLQLESTIGYSIQSGFYRQGRWVIQAANRLDFDINFNHMIDFAGSVSMQWNNNLFMVSFGHRDYTAQIDSVVRKDSNQLLSGFYIAAVSDIGFIHSGKWINLQQSFSDGTWGIIFKNNQAEYGQFEQKNLIFELGFVGGETTLFFIRHGFTLPSPAPFSVNINERFNSFAPSGRFANYLRDKMSLHSLLLELEFSPELILNRWGFINPYMLLGAGYHKASGMRDGLYDLNESFLVSIGAVEAGLRWYGVKFFDASLRYGLNLSVNYTFPLAAVDYVSGYLSNGVAGGKVSFAVGLTIAADP